jgi:hypothetical protein
MSRLIPLSDTRERVVPSGLQEQLRGQAPRSTRGLVQHPLFNERPLSLHPALVSALAGAEQGLKQGLKQGLEPRRQHELIEIHRLLAPFDGQSVQLDSAEEERLAAFVAARAADPYPEAPELLLDLVAQRGRGPLSGPLEQELRNEAAILTPTHPAAQALVAAITGARPLEQAARYGAEAVALLVNARAAEFLQVYLLDLGQACSPFRMEP